MENGHAPRVALIVPASNTVMETDFARAGDPALEVTVWRIQLDSVTREAEERMLDEELPAREWASPTTMKSGKVAPDDIVSFVSRRMRGLNPDAVFLSCTNWRAVEALAPLSDALGLPVLTSNQVRSIR